MEARRKIAIDFSEQLALDPDLMLEDGNFRIAECGDAKREAEEMRRFDTGNDDYLFIKRFQDITREYLKVFFSCVSLTELISFSTQTNYFLQQFSYRIFTLNELLDIVNLHYKLKIFIICFLYQFSYRIFTLIDLLTWHKSAL